MDFLKLACARYSTRKYLSKPVSPENVSLILEAARCAPTAHNNQPQRIITVQSRQGLALLEKCTVCRYGAPLAFIVCYDKNEAWIREYDCKSSGDVDASIVTTHMMLQAESLGIGTTWIMNFIPAAVSAEFELPDETVPAAILYAGYSDEGPSPRHSSRNKTEKFVIYR